MTWQESMSTCPIGLEMEALLVGNSRQRLAAYLCRSRGLEARLMLMLDIRGEDRLVQFSQRYERQATDEPMTVVSPWVMNMP